MKRVLIYFDYEHIENSLELIGVASRIYPSDEYTIDAINLSNQNECLIDRVNTIIHSTLMLDAYDYINITKLIEELHANTNYQCILFPSSRHGRIIAPRVAMSLHLGLIADITDIQINNGKLEIIRPAYGGKIMASIECVKDTLMMSVRENVFKSNTYPKRISSVVEVELKAYQPNQIKLLSKVEKKDLVQDIRQSEILVSGGYGIVENFNQIYALAELLDGHVSASRKIVDHGVVSRKIQVGQSGKTVSPKLYIALGISGSTQHIEGLRNIETIISVNTSEYAPLNSIADVVVLGDAVDFTNRLIDKINKERKGS
jgi:electron transfer flavoprotein alpha subunit